MLNPTDSILVVDDDPINLLLLEELLLCEGYFPLLATSGIEALEIAAQSVPSLILLDVMMPGLDGFEVCRHLREDVRLQAIPIIFITALDDDQSRLRGLEVMGDDYLTRPINNQLLLTKIANLLRLNQMRSQHYQSTINQLVKERSRQQIAAAWQINDYLSEKFRLFVPEQYLHRIAPKGVESIQLGNCKEEEITVLFCDIRGFSEIAECQSARETFEWLNVFLTQMSQAIATHQGFVDKFLGDAIFAVFDRVGSHAEDALNAAVLMQHRLREFNRERDRYNLNQPIHAGIGIHTGIGLIGTLGCDDRMDSTVIGDVVNTAARVEELTKLYGTPILASDTTIRQVSASFNKADFALQDKDNSTYSPYLLPSYPSRWVDRVTPRGKRRALELYEILGTATHPLDIAKLQAQPYYSCGLQAWHQKDFSQALDYFQKVVKQNPADRVARLYLERCQARLGVMPQPPEVPWQGVAAS